MENFDFKGPADVFLGNRRPVGRSGFARRTAVKYLRFATGGEAIQYVIESLTAAQLSAAIVEADCGRFAAEEIRKLYERTDYPLARRRETVPSTT